MNKKQYFIFLWALCSIAPLLHCVYFLKGIIFVKNIEAPVNMLIGIGYLWTIIASGIALTFGLDFGSRIGIKFFLWKDKDFDWKKDIIMPTIFLSILYAIYIIFFGGMHVYGNPTLFLPLQGKFVITSLPYVFYIFNAMAGLLFWLSTFVVILTKISKKTPVSHLIPIGIIILSIIIVLMQSGQCQNSALCIRNIIIPILAMILLWKKGFETLLCTGFCIAFISYMAEPIKLLLTR